MAQMTEYSQARELVESISDEVKDFHPLLKIVLPELPSVKDCEYTHGKDEWGADFILTVEDTILGGLEHIGVIVKRGSIKQDLRNIDTQIEECRMKKRKIRGGTKEIEIDRVWIVANGSISNNAKEKIHLKHRGTGISFIDGAKLAELIVQHTPFIGDSVTPEIAEYLQRVQTKVESRRERRDMLAMSEDTPEIELDIVELKREPDGYARQELVKFEDIIEHSGGIMILEGRAGAGKTREMEKHTRHYASTSEYKRTNRAPVLIPARELRDQYEWNIMNAIEGEVGEMACIKLRDEKSKILLFVDGLDEVPEETEEKKKILERIKLEMDSNWSGHTTIVSTHTGEDLLLGSEIDIREFSIRAVSLKKLLAFIIDTCKNVQMPIRMAEDLRKSDLFHQLPQNPIAAILLSKIIREEGKELPSNLTEIYAKATELMLGRWDQQKGIVQEKEYLVVRYVLERIAREMVENQMWEVSIDWIEEQFSEYIDERKLNIRRRKLSSRL